MKYTACFGRNEIELFVPPENSVLISIKDPKSPPVNVELAMGWIGIAHLAFWDMEKTIYYHPKKMNLEPAEDWQIKMIHDFIKEHKDKNIFAHCEAGISRSAAVREYLIQRGWKYWDNNGQRAVFPNTYILNQLKKLDFKNE